MDASDASQLILYSLQNPIRYPKLSKIVAPGDKAVINISDLTRPYPSKEILTHVSDKLGDAGITDNDLIIVMESGLQRQMTSNEIENSISKSIFQRFQIINHDPNDTIYLGETSLDTQVDIFRLVVEADLRIYIGLEF